MDPLRGEGGLGFWILSDEHPPEEIEVDRLVWAEWFENSWPERQVAVTEIKGGPRISTVFLGLNHQFGDGPPLLYESMAFGKSEWHPGMSDGEVLEYQRKIGSEPPRLMREGRWVDPDEDCERCSTWNEAVQQHEAMVEKWAKIVGAGRPRNG